MKLKQKIIKAVVDLTPGISMPLFPEATAFIEHPEEKYFKKELAQQLKDLPYQHDVYFAETEDGYENFKIKGTRKRVDLLIRTNPTWEHHAQYPYLGVETKVARKAGWIIEAIQQCKSYAELSKVHYYLGDQEIKPPKLILLCTDDSWKYGQLYKWREPRLDFKSPEYREGFWDGITEIFERVLWKVGVAILRDGWFLYRQKRYNLYLETAKKEGLLVYGKRKPIS